MKCDELQEKIQITNDSRMVYLKSEVDAAIEELKDIIKNNQSAYYVDLGIVANDCEKLKAENERLTIDKRNEELRADQADAAIAEFKAENRRLKRALWLARASAAKFWANYWEKVERLCRHKAEKHK